MERREDEPREEIIKPVPEDNQSHKGADSAPAISPDIAMGHRDAEKHNTREQAATDGSQD